MMEKINLVRKILAHHRRSITIIVHKLSSVVKMNEEIIKMYKLAKIGFNKENDAWQR